MSCSDWIPCVQEAKLHHTKWLLQCVKAGLLFLENGWWAESHPVSLICLLEFSYKLLMQTTFTESMPHSYGEFCSSLTLLLHTHKKLCFKPYILGSKCSGFQAGTYLYIKIHLCTSAQVGEIASSFKVSPPGIRIQFVHFFFSFSWKCTLVKYLWTKRHSWNLLVFNMSFSYYRKRHPKHFFLMKRYC